MRYLFSILLFAAAIGAVSQNAALDRLLRTPGLEYALVGVSVIDLKSGKCIVEHNKDMALVPASTLKLVTTATAMSLYPDDHRFKTEVCMKGSVRNGVLDGDLIVRGSGDPSLGSAYSTHGAGEFVDGLVAALQKKGIRSVGGRMIVDESVWDGQGVSPEWIWEDIGNYFAAGCYGVNYADNTYELILDTSVKGRRPVVKGTNPVIEGISFDNYLTNQDYPFDSAYIYGAPFSNERSISGAVPQKGKEFRVKGDIPDPARHLGEVVRKALLSKNISVKGEVLTARMLNLADNGGLAQGDIAGGECIYTFESDPLPDIVRVTNVKSNNLYAEAMLRLVGQTANDATPVTTSGALDVIARHWSAKGLDKRALMMKDGCGLAPGNRVTPGFMTGLLEEMNPNKSFVNTLPLSGVEGTVAGFLKNTPMEGKARLKSGTIGGVVAYAGYLDGKSRYAVCLMVNNYNGKASAIRKALEKMLVEMNL